MLINLLCVDVEYPNQLTYKGTQEGQKEKSVDENQKPPFNRTFVSILRYLTNWNVKLSVKKSVFLMVASFRTLEFIEAQKLEKKNTNGLQRCYIKKVSKTELWN